MMANSISKMLLRYYRDLLLLIYLDCHLRFLLQITVSGFTGTSYPDDLPGQKTMYSALLKPLVELVLGPGTEFELFPRRGAIRNGTLPPCEVFTNFPRI